MVALTYHSGIAKHQRGTLVDLSSAEQKQCDNDPTLKQLDDGTMGDGRLYFHESAEAALNNSPNLHGVNRNIRYVSAPQIVNHFLDAHLLGGARISDHEEITPYPER